MAGVIEFQFNPGESVWVINSNNCATPSNSSVQEGVVIRIRSEILITTPPLVGSPLTYDDVLYDVRLGSSSGTTEFKESDVFGTLSEAITEYQARISG